MMAEYVFLFKVFFCNHVFEVMTITHLIKIVRIYCFSLELILSMYLYHKNLVVLVLAYSYTAWYLYNFYSYRYIIYCTNKKGIPLR